MSVPTIISIFPSNVTLSEVESKDYMETIERAILLTVAYADVFDYPLTAREIHRYLIGVQASFEIVSQALHAGQHTTRFLSFQQDYFTLRGRESIVETRKQRAAIANKLWPKARFYGKLIARLPFVRMVAVTGALAMDNTDSHADIDFMIVTEPGRLWLCRALVILLVRWAALWSDTICPNLFISEEALVYHQRGLYTAHEMAQIVPIAGRKLYQRMMSLNAWALKYLPNTQINDYAHIELPINLAAHLVQKFAEKLLSIPGLDWLERWEMRRKIRKFKRQYSWSDEPNFSSDWCRGYFNSHEQQTLSAYAERVSIIEAARRR